MRKSILSVLSVMFLTFILNGAWYANWPPIPNTNSEPGLESIDNSIVDGASNILRSYSNFILLINESELSSKYGFNYEKALDIIDCTMGKLVVARSIYSNVMTIYKKNTIDFVMIKKLVEFNYDELARARKLHIEVMDEVKSYLAVCDIAGYFEKIVEDTDTIIGLLKEVRTSIQNNKIPDIEELRTIYQKFSDYMLFGYYSSLVFSEIK